MAGQKAKQPCEHGLSDQVEITDRTLVEDYRHRTRTVIWGYYCTAHQAFGSYMSKETNVAYPPRESTAPPAANA